ncbi:MAG: hypothetical protein J0L93_06505 [Deltaproteobacteria bacterium]|nr:hypothetical protein [Deltaproteobacteria bacterium]
MSRKPLAAFVVGVLVSSSSFALVPANLSKKINDCVKERSENLGMRDFHDIWSAAILDKGATAMTSFAAKLARDIVGTPPEASVSKGKDGEEIYSIGIYPMHTNLKDEEKKQIVEQICATYYPHMSGGSQNLCSKAFDGRMKLWREFIAKNQYAINQMSERILKGDHDWQQITSGVHLSGAEQGTPTDTLFRYGWTARIGGMNLMLSPNLYKRNLLSGSKPAGYTVKITLEGTNQGETFAILPAPDGSFNFENPIFYSSGGVSARDYNCHMKEVYKLEELTTADGKKLC